MIDVVGEALQAAGSASSLAYPLCFAAGMVTSLGPCVAPRYIAVAALANNTRRGWWNLAAFLAGLIGAYVALGLSAASLGALWSSSRALYLALAVGLAVSGVATVAGARSERGSHRHSLAEAQH
ncbi:MAG: sulfite exporter TauE/SafE family protein, partial [Candidatus Elarobacter sp.]